jgi:hypothetical protein
MEIGRAMARMVRKFESCILKAGGCSIVRSCGFGGGTGAFYTMGIAGLLCRRVAVYNA